MIWLIAIITPILKLILYMKKKCYLRIEKEVNY
jgi:hypothetical protein